MTKTGDKLEMELRRKNGGVYKWISLMVSYLPDYSGSKTTGGPGGAFY